jgi:saccharopine dehydrogenase (NAD+, L-lysine-forming)
VGTVIAGHLAPDARVRRLTLADVDEQFARAAAARFPGTSKVGTRALDASNPAALESAFEGVELVIQASLPRFNAGIQAACLAVGANYMDLATDSTDPYVNDAEWQAHRLTALLGMGEDPGLSNIMARQSADGLDHVESIRVRDGDTGSNPAYPFLPVFSPETFLEETLHGSRVWEHGKYRDVPPFGDGELYEFPPPVGPQKVYSVDHEEVDSLPRYIGKGVQYVDFKLALDDTAVRTLLSLRDLRLLERGTPESPGPLRMVLNSFPKPADLAGKVDGDSMLIVETKGEKDGHAVEETFSTVLNHRRTGELHQVTAVAYLTGTPAAVAALQMVGGTITAPGMLAPERLDPKPFFPMLRERGIPIRLRRTVEQEFTG